MGMKRLRALSVIGMMIILLLGSVGGSIVQSMVSPENEVGDEGVKIDDGEGVVEPSSGEDSESDTEPDGETDGSTVEGDYVGENIDPKDDARSVESNSEEKVQERRGEKSVKRDEIRGQTSFQQNSAEPASNGGEDGLVEIVDGVSTDPEKFGWNVTLVDLNGNGIDDLVVGAPGNESDRGAVYVFLGKNPPQTWTAESISPENANVSISGGQPGDLFGWDVANTSDVTGNGENDLLIGAPGNDSDTGTVYLFQGGESWWDTGSSGAELSVGDAYHAVKGEYSGDKFGASVSGAGDVDSSGNDDFIVGAWNTSVENGSAYLFKGDASIPTSASNADIQLNGKNEGDKFGFSVSEGGDVDGDGNGDVLVGAPGTDEAYVYYGPDLGTDTTLFTESTGEDFGWSVANLGGFSGTSDDSVAVGAPGASNGKVYLFSDENITSAEGSVKNDTAAEFNAGNPTLSDTDVVGSANEGNSNWDGRVNLTATNQFYDGFENDLSKWSLYETGGSISRSTASSIKGSYSCKLNDTDTSDHVQLESNSWTAETKGVAEFHGKIDSGDGLTCWLAGYDSFYGKWYSTAIVAFKDGYIQYYDGSFNQIMEYSQDTWYQIQIHYNNDNSEYDVYVNDTEGKLSLKESSLGYYNNLDSRKIYIDTNPDDQSVTPTAYVDEVRACTYPNEPGHIKSTTTDTGSTITGAKFNWNVTEPDTSISTTDITLQISRDGGSTWNQSALTEGKWYYFGSGAGKGSDLVYKVTFDGDGDFTPILYDINIEYSTLSPECVIEGEEVGDKFGYSLSQGRFTGKGPPDLAVGAPYTDVGSGSQNGTIYIFNGSKSSPTSISDAEYNHSGPDGSLFGYSSSIGKVNGDSNPDILVGAPGYNNDDGKASVLSKSHQYTLDISSTAGGSVVDPGEGPIEYDRGTTVDLEAIADQDYYFVEWTGDNGTIGDTTANQTTITMEGYYSITAEFEAYVNLTIDSTAGGSVVDPGEGESDYKNGAVVDLEAVANESCHFVEWTGDNGTIADTKSNKTTIEMSSDHSITAEFNTPPDVNLTRPDGGEIFTPGNTETIWWNTSDEDSNADLTVDLYYSNDSGTSWNTITTGIAGMPNNYDWPVPDDPSTECLVRVDATDTYGLTSSKESANTFTIGNPGSDVIVTAPANATENAHDNYTYSYTVENNGSVDDTYDLTVDSSDTDWNVKVPSTVFVTSGSMESVKVNVTIPDSADDGDFTNVTLTAESQNGSHTDDDVMKVTFEHPGSEVIVTAPSDTTENDKKTFTYDFDVENNHDLNDTYDLTVSETAGWIVNVQGNVSVAAGTNVTVTVEVTIPGGAGYGDFSDVNLTATSQNNTEVVDWGQMRITYEPALGVNVTAPKDQNEADSGTYTYEFEVENTGDAEDTYDLTVNSSNSNWTVSAPDRISVAVGTTEIVTVEVTIPSDVMEEESSDINLTATSENRTDVTHSDIMKLFYISDLDVAVTAPADSGETSVGTFSYHFTVNNTGDVEDTYILSAEADETGWSASSVLSEITLGPDEETLVEVEVTIPQEAGVGAFSNINLEATSQNHSAITDSDEMRVTYEPTFGVDVRAPGDQTETDHGTHSYDFEVENTGDVDDTYELEVYSSNADWTVSAPDQVFVAAEATEVVAVEVTLPQDVTAGDFSDIKLNATSQNSTQMDENGMRVTYEEYVLTVQNPDNGTIYVEGNEVTEPEENFTYSPGYTVDIEAVSDEGYHFLRWAGNTGTIDNTSAALTTIEMQGDYELMAEFSVELYELTINVDGEGTTDPEGTQTYEYGEEVAVEAIPAEGWIFQNWTGDVPEGEEEESNMTLLINEDKSVTAHFAEDSHFEVEIISPEDGSEYVEGDEVVVDYRVRNLGGVEGTQTIELTVYDEADESVYQDQKNVTLGPVNLTADGVYEGEFVWAIEEGSTGSYDLMVSSGDEDKEVTVTVLEEYELTIAVEGSGSTDPEPGVYTHYEGTEVTVRATPEERWKFIEWTGDIESSEEEITITMDADYNITAHFEEEDVGVEVVSPGDDDIFNKSEVEVEWDSRNADNHEIRVDEGDWINVGGKTAYVFEELEDGEHLIEVRVTGMDETIQDEVSIVVDTVPPEIELTSPKDGENIAEVDVRMEWEGSDETTGIEGYEVRLDGDKWIDVGGETNYTFESLEEGSHTVEVRTKDVAGNEFVESLTFTVDVTAPELNIIAPGDDENISGKNVTGEWEGSDEISGIASYNIRLNGEEWIEVGEETSYTFEELEEGEYTLEVRALDAAGNEEIETVNFNVKSDDGSDSVGLGNYWWIFLLIPLILIPILFFWKRREEEEEEEGEILEEMEKLDKSESEFVEESSQSVEEELPVDEMSGEEEAVPEVEEPVTREEEPVVDEFEESEEGVFEEGSEPIQEEAPGEEISEESVSEGPEEEPMEETPEAEVEEESVEKAVGEKELAVGSAAASQTKKGESIEESTELEEEEEDTEAEMDEELEEEKLEEEVSGDVEGPATVSQIDEEETSIEESSELEEEEEIDEDIEAEIDEELEMEEEKFEEEVAGEKGSAGGPVGASQREDEEPAAVDDEIFYECKECGFLTTGDEDECPYCGAPLEKEGDSEEKVENKESEEKE